MKMRNILDAAEFTKDIINQLIDYPYERDDVKTLISELVIVTPTKLFEADSEGVVQEYQDFTAIGSGSAYVLGALDILYPKLKQDDEVVPLLYRCLETACNFSSSCGKPFEVLYFD